MVFDIDIFRSVEIPLFSPVSRIAAILSQCIVGTVLIPNSDSSLLTQMLCLAANASATYLATVVESDTVFCFFNRHMTVCPRVWIITLV